VTAGDIMSGSVRSDDESARRFLAAVSTSTDGQRQASAASAPRPPAAPAAAPAPAAPANAQSFPLADPKPGSEPK